MAKDFRANQIRSNAIIASGSDWNAKTGGAAREKPRLGMLMYSASSASDYDGNIHGLGHMLNESGNEAWLIISGSSTAKHGSQFNHPQENGGAVLFMGDVIISGTLFGTRQVIIVDKEVPGDLYIQNALHASGNIFVGPTTWTGPTVVQTKKDGSTNEINVGQPDLIATTHGDNSTTPPQIAFGAIDRAKSKHLPGGLIAGPLAGSPSDAGSRAGHEAFFWVSGSVGAINRGRGGVAVFGGDMVISGNLITSGTNNIVEYHKNIILNYSQSMNPRPSAAVPLKHPPMFGHDYTYSPPYAFRYDRWHVKAEYPDVFDGSIESAALAHNYESIIQTGGPTGWSESASPVPRAWHNNSHLVLSSAYTRLVVSGNGTVAISRIGNLDKDDNLGENGGILRFAGSGSNISSPDLGPSIFYNTSLKRFVIKNAGDEKVNHPIYFASGTVTASNGLHFGRATAGTSKARKDRQGQAAGISFRGDGTSWLGNSYSDAGLFYNEGTNRRNRYHLGPQNTLILTASSLSSNLKVGAAGVLNLDGYSGITLTTGEWGHPSGQGGASAFNVYATGNGVLSASNGWQMHSDDGSVEISGGTNNSTGDVVISGSRNITIDSGFNFGVLTDTWLQLKTHQQDPSAGTNNLLTLDVHNAGSGEGRMSLDAKTYIKIGTEERNSSYPDITIGNTNSTHTTDIKTSLHVSGDTIVDGNLEVRGDFIKGHVITASVGDPLMLLNSGAVRTPGGNPIGSDAMTPSGGGIAIASGSTFDRQAMVFGRSTSFSNTFVAGRLDVEDGLKTTLAGAVPIDIHTAGIRMTNAGMVLTEAESAGTSIYNVTMSNGVGGGAIIIAAGEPLDQGPMVLSGTMFSFETGSPIKLLENGDSSGDISFNVESNKLVTRIRGDGFRLVHDGGNEVLEFGDSNQGILKINGTQAGGVEDGLHIKNLQGSLYMTASRGTVGDIILSASRDIRLISRLQGDVFIPVDSGQQLKFSETLYGTPSIYIDPSTEYLKINGGNLSGIWASRAVHFNDTGKSISPFSNQLNWNTDFGVRSDGGNLELRTFGGDNKGVNIWADDTDGGFIVADAGQVRSGDNQSRHSGAIMVLSRSTGHGGTSYPGYAAFGERRDNLEATFTTSHYTDVSFYVSGAIRHKNANKPGIALFGGDVVVSGTLYASSSYTDRIYAGDVLLTGSDGAISFQDEHKIYITKDSGGNLVFKDAVVGGTKTLTDLSNAPVADNATVFHITHGAPSYVVTTGSFSFDTLNRKTNVTPAPGGPGTDTYFFVSGSRGARNMLPSGLHQRGVTLFAGDVHVSGSLTSTDTIFGGSLENAYNTPDGGGAQQTGIGGTITVSTHRPVTLKQWGADTPVSEPLLQLSGGIKIGQLRIAPSQDGGVYKDAVFYNTASNGQISFGTGGVSDSNTAFQITATNANVLMGIGTLGNSKKLAFSPSEASTYLQYTNNNASNPGPRVLHMNNLTSEGRISFAMGNSGAANGSGYEGLMAISGSIEPGYDNVYNLGSANKRFANLYTGDLHLRNERGDWTIYEEADMLVVVNNLTGKKYKMGLTPLEDDE